MRWYSVEDKLPKNRSIVWVRKLTDGVEEIEIAVFDSGDSDNENVTHWQRIKRPSAFGTLTKNSSKRVTTHETT